MTEPRSVEERISLWLEEEAVGQLPDRTLDATFERTRAIRRRPGPSPWRPFPMSRPFSSLIAVGAAVIAIAIGASVLRPSPSPAPAAVGASASPSAVVTTAPSVVPTPRPRPYGLAIVGLDGSIGQELGLPVDAWSADLSADGSRIIFSSTSSAVGTCAGCTIATRRLAVVDVGRQAGAFLDVNDRADFLAEQIAMPAWSPDGTKVAFSGVSRDGNTDIYMAELGTTEDTGMISTIVRRLTFEPEVDEFPAWTADGTTILYDNAGAEALDDSGFSPTQEIFSVPFRGGHRVRLTNDDDPDSMPDVAADGTVAYWHGGDIWTMSLDGTDQRALSAVPAGLGFNPRWSPDSKRMALLQYDPSERARFDLAMRLPGDLPLLKVVVVDLSTGAVTNVGPRFPSDGNPVSWTADGAALLVYRFDQPN